MNRILYYHPQSNFSRKIRILLTEKHLSYELKAINLMNKPPSFLELSPIGKVPVLVDEDSTIIWDSSLIAEYLDEKYPEPRFYPNNFKERLECRKWEDLADTLGDKIISLWIFNLTNKENSTPYQSALEKSINNLFSVLEKQVAKTQYLLGGEIWSIADISALCSCGYYNLRFNENWKLNYPNLKNWFDQLHERESVFSTIPQSM
ncbi:MAG TPA: glutathione S-transferase family protein [Cyanothece sp. UBA12306]|nr:glutathione S-transferase family protein [Cyanothece sp. UBA12306]